MTTTESSTRRHPVRRTAVAVALVALAAACGSTDSGRATQAPSRPQRTTSSAAPTSGAPTSAAPVDATAGVRPTDEVDRLVSIPGGRIHLRCTGHGDTTVVLIAGSLTAWLLSS